jgi:formylmethanofuran dehydrogenase subunit E
MLNAQTQPTPAQDEQPETTLQCEGSFCTELVPWHEATCLNDKVYCPDCAAYLAELENDPSVHVRGSY